MSMRLRLANATVQSAGPSDSYSNHPEGVILFTDPRSCRSCRSNADRKPAQLKQGSRRKLQFCSPLALLWLKKPGHVNGELLPAASVASCRRRSILAPFAARILRCNSRGTRTPRVAQAPVRASAQHKKGWERQGISSDADKCAAGELAW